MQTVRSKPSACSAPTPLAPESVYAFCQARHDPSSRAILSHVPIRKEGVATHVVTDNCVNCKYTDCVEVCPVDCFHEGPNFLAIDPQECIDCTLCIPECPAFAIFPEDDVPGGQEHYVQVNAELAPLWPVIAAQGYPR